MKFNTTMPVSLKPFFEKELQDAESAFSQNNLTASWRHLEERMS